MYTANRVIPKITESSPTFTHKGPVFDLRTAYVVENADPQFLLYKVNEVHGQAAGVFKSSVTVDLAGRKNFDFHLLGGSKTKVSFKVQLVDGQTQICKITSRLVPGFYAFFDGSNWFLFEAAPVPDAQ